MKIMFMKEDCLLSIKSNLAQFKENFVNKDSSWINEHFGENCFEYTKFEVNDFELDMSESNSTLTEFENVKRIYENLCFLSESQASDERLWAGLCVHHFWNYVQYRWNIKSNCSENNIKQHFFFGFQPRRSLTRNAISRLWWIGKLTYDNTREDPYELTKFVCENSDYILHILERNTSNNPMIVRAFVSALIAARNNGFLINTNVVGELSKFLNLLGGTYLLDSLSYESIYAKVLDRAQKLEIRNE